MHVKLGNNTLPHFMHTPSTSWNNQTSLIWNKISWGCWYHTIFSKLHVKQNNFAVIFNQLKNFFCKLQLSSVNLHWILSLVNQILLHYAEQMLDDKGCFLFNKLITVNHKSTSNNVHGQIKGILGYIYKLRIIRRAMTEICV